MGEREVFELVSGLTHTCLGSSSRGVGAGASDQQGQAPSLSHPCRLCPVPAERDVSRTDRTNKFYEGPENPGLGLLNDILLTYCMYHFDLGAAQPGNRGLWREWVPGARAEP